MMSLSMTGGGLRSAVFLEPMQNTLVFLGMKLCAFLLLLILLCFLFFATSKIKF